MSDSACPHRESAYDWLTGRLAGTEKSAFEEHLAGCDSCRAEVAALETALGHLAAWTPPRLSPAFTSQVLARIESPRPGLAARLGGWFRFRPLPMVAGALVAAGLVVAVIGFFPQILSDQALRDKRRIVTSDLVARRARTEEPVKMAGRSDRVRTRPRPAEKAIPPAPPPPAPPPVEARPAPRKPPVAMVGGRTISPAKQKHKKAARPRSTAPLPEAADRSRLGVRPRGQVTPAPAKQYQRYSVPPHQRFISRKPATSVRQRRSAGQVRSAPRMTRSVRPAPAPKQAPLKAAIVGLERKRRLPRNLATVLSLVQRYGGTVRRPYRNTARGLILEVTLPPANRRVFLTRLRGLKGQGITRLGTDRGPIRVLVSKFVRTAPASPAR